MAQRVKSNKKALKRETKRLITPVNIGTDRIRGSIDAPISIVEYGDYEMSKYWNGLSYSQRNNEAVQYQSLFCVSKFSSH